MVSKNLLDCIVSCCRGRSLLGTVQGADIASKINSVNTALGDQGADIASKIKSINTALGTVQGADIASKIENVVAMSLHLPDILNNMNDYITDLHDATPPKKLKATKELLEKVLTHFDDIDKLKALADRIGASAVSGILPTHTP